MEEKPERRFNIEYKTVVISLCKRVRKTLNYFVDNLIELFKDSFAVLMTKEETVRTFVLIDPTNPAYKDASYSEVIIKGLGPFFYIREESDFDAKNIVKPEIE